MKFVLFIISIAFSSFAYSSTTHKENLIQPEKNVIHFDGRTEREKRINRKRKRKCHRYARKSFAG